MRRFGLGTALALEQRTGALKNFHLLLTHHNRVNAMLLRNFVNHLYPAHGLKSNLGLEHFRTVYFPFLCFRHLPSPIEDHSLNCCLKSWSHYSAARNWLSCNG